MSKIFISHSSKDKELVDIFIDTLLICGIGFTHDDIFCTSVEGLGIKTGDDWRNTIKKNLIGSEVIILFITPNYKESEICLNEMGAAWATHARVLPVIVHPISFKTIGVIFDVKQAIRLTEGTDLDDLKDALQVFVSTTNSPTARWTTKKQEAIVIFKQKLEPSPFLTPLSRDVFTKLEEELSETKQAFSSVVAEKQQLSNLCNKLEKAKDKQEVTDIKHAMGLLGDDNDVFFAKTNEIGKKINEFNLAVRTIIFNEFTKTGLSLTCDNRRSYEDELNQALAKKIIDEEQNLNHQHPQVAKVLKLLADFEVFFPEKLSEKTYEKLAAEYSNISFETDSSDFWEDVFGVQGLLY